MGKSCIHAYVNLEEHSKIKVRNTLNLPFECLCTRKKRNPIQTLQSRTTDAQWSLFPLKSRTFGLGQTYWADKFWGIWGIFGQTISTHFGKVSPCVPLFSHYFYKKLSVYNLNSLSKYLFGFGFEFEFEPQRIRDLAFICP